MRRTIPQRELRNQNAQILAAVQAGATFVVTRNGEPVAELRPLASRGRTRFVSKADVLKLAAEGPHINGADFRADLEATIDQSLYG